MHAQRQTSDVALWNRIKARIKDWIPADPIGWGDRMRRRDLLLSALGVSLLPTSAPAQGPDRVWRVGVLRPTRPVVDLLRQFTLPELARIGFVEGRNLTLRLGRRRLAPGGDAPPRPRAMLLARLSCLRRPAYRKEQVERCWQHCLAVVTSVSRPRAALRR